MSDTLQNEMDRLAMKLLALVGHQMVINGTVRLECEGGHVRVVKPEPHLRVSEKALASGRP